ncbi:MAG: hypothetical protein WCA44_01675 [Acidobacteriaceae bacterium]|jgi:hypothetical protein
MASRSISIPVDAQTERAWGAIGAEERRKIETFLGVWARELATRKPEPLKDVLDEAGRAAEERGLTPEILDSILNGD